MASVLQETLKRIIGKSEILIQKYEMLQADKDAADKVRGEVEAVNEDLRKEVEKLRLENESLRLMRSITPDPETLAKNKAIIAKLVQDIDKCMAQLTE